MLLASLRATLLAASLRGEDAVTTSRQACDALLACVLLRTNVTTRCDTSPPCRRLVVGTHTTSCVERSARGECPTEFTDCMDHPTTTSPASVVFLYYGLCTASMLLVLIVIVWFKLRTARERAAAVAVRKPSMLAEYPSNRSPTERESWAPAVPLSIFQTSSAPLRPSFAMFNTIGRVSAAPPARRDCRHPVHNDHDDDDDDANIPVLETSCHILFDSDRSSTAAFQFHVEGIHNEATTPS